MGTSPQHADQQKTDLKLHRFLSKRRTGPYIGFFPPTHPIFLEMMTAEERREYANWESLLDAANRGIRRWRGLATRTIAVDHERKTVTVQQEGA